MINNPSPWNKPPTDVNRQIELLKERNLEITDDAKAKNFLFRVNYCRTCRYTSTLSGKENDFSGVSFEQLNEFYSLDRRARSSILSALSGVEVFFRTELAYIVSIGTNDPFWYLKPDNFLDKCRFDETIGDVESDLKKNWLGKKGKGSSWPDDIEALPAWEMVEVVSFGKLSKMFSNLKKVTYIDKVGGKLGFGKDQIKTVIRAMVCLRNDCAHHSKILGSTFPIYPPEVPSMKTCGFDNKMLGGFVFCIAKALSSEPTFRDSFVDEMTELKTCFPEGVRPQLGFGDMDSLKRLS